MSLQHHDIFADKSIAKDSVFEHITLSNESQMGIPHFTSVNLECHSQTLKTHGQYQPTMNDLVEAQQQNAEISSMASLYWSFIIQNVSLSLLY
jgi:hypothetical protein